MANNSLLNRFKNAWNIFNQKELTEPFSNAGMSYVTANYDRIDRARLPRSSERTIIASIYNRIATDASAVPIKHVKIDQNGRYIKTIDSTLNNCLNVEANLDQTGREFIYDVIISMFTEGYVALVPIDVDVSLTKNNSFDILSMRTGKIVEWMPEKVKVNVYNERTGEKEDLTLRKDKVGIIENPFYMVMNDHGSTVSRLISKLNLLDTIDNAKGSDKLNMIIQLPYTAKSQAKKEYAKDRLKEIEGQLEQSSLGIAYIDSTEHITQLNRSVENDLNSQIERLTKLLYNQLGVSETVFDGTADEATMLNYYNQTIEPILSAITGEIYRKFLTKTARTQGQSIQYFRDPFRLVPVKELAEIADTFTRNEILSSNEVRAVVGMRPVDTMEADELRNKNLNRPDGEMVEPTEYVEEPYDEYSEEDMTEEEYLAQMAELDEFDSQLDDMEADIDDAMVEEDELKHYASPYYDPVKAHEYYMKNRELKGRTSTKGLSEEGKKAAAYVKKQLSEERKAKQKANTENTKAEIKKLSEKRKSDANSYSEKTKAQIKSIQEKLKGMTRIQKAKNGPALKKQIESLREDNKARRKQLAETYKNSSKSLRDKKKQDNANLKTEYDKKYESELDKIRASYGSKSKKG